MFDHIGIMQGHCHRVRVQGVPVLVYFGVVESGIPVFRAEKV